MNDGDAINRALKDNKGHNSIGKWSTWSGKRCIGGSMQRVGASRSQINRIRRASVRHLGERFEDINDGHREAEMRRKMERLARKLDTTSSRKGVRHQQRQEQKRTDKQASIQNARQHTSAAPALWLVVALVLTLLVIRFAHVLLLAAEGLAALTALTAAGWLIKVAGPPLWEKVIQEPNWAHVAVWRQTRREVAGKRAALLAEAEAASQPIALGPAAPISVDDVLKRDWVQPAELVKERSTSR